MDATEKTDKKSRIMAAAEGLFKTGQFHEITLDEVSRVADVGKGTIYQYFASKDELFFQTAIAAFDEMVALLSRHVSDAGPVDRHLRRACEVVCRFAEERRRLFRLIHAEAERALGRGGGLRQRWMQHRRKMTQVLAEILRRGAQRGEVRDDLSPEVLAEYFLGMLRARLNELEEMPERARSPRALVDLFVQGAAARGGETCRRGPRRPPRRGK